MAINAHPPESAAEAATGPRIGAALGLGLLAAALALSLFVWLGYLIHPGEPTGLDLMVRAWLGSLQSAELTSLMWAASVYGAPVRLSPIGVVLAVLFLVRGWYRGALLVIVTLAGAGLLDTGLKLFFGRTRPEAFFTHYPAPPSYSFPSGHALFATCFFGGIAVLLSHRLRSRAARALVWAIAVTLIVVIGASRVYLGVHYPTDVVAGYAVGVVWVAAVALGDRLATPRARLGV
ncbi:MAG: phosphatase PAP2 family protein [Gemmatimonadales bacterium]|nr:phosphatase PAP2 family protein [Gemmatimonadales bacterium]